MKANKKIVVFGPDNSGKTTLVQMIVDRCAQAGYPIEKIKSLGPVSVDKQIIYTSVNLEKPNAVIFDRFPVIEEATCGVILRQHDNFSQMPEVVQKFLDGVDVFIFCNPGLNAILNWGEREQMEGIKENIFQLFFEYCLVYRQLRDMGKTVIEYNWQVPGCLYEVLREVLSE